MCPVPQQLTVQSLCGGICYKHTSASNAGRNRVALWEKYPKRMRSQISFWVQGLGSHCANGGLRLFLLSINLLIIFVTSVPSMKDDKNGKENYPGHKALPVKISFCCLTNKKTLFDEEKQQILTGTTREQRLVEELFNHSNDWIIFYFINQLLRMTDPQSNC